MDALSLPSGEAKIDHLLEERKESCFSEITFVKL